MSEDDIAGRQRLLELGQALLGWKGEALRIYAELPTESIARSTIDCVLTDSIDRAIDDLVKAVVWPPLPPQEEEA